jgi:prepilin peptidase CpaA
MDWQSLVFEHWQVKLVTVTLLVAAWIDGKELKVPNWITFPMVLSGLFYNMLAGGWEGTQFALIGIGVGLMTLLPLYAIGGMGAGDVKLMAGIGAWLGGTVTWHTAVVTYIVGGVMGAAMAIYKGTWRKHLGNCAMILHEIKTVKDPRQIADNAAARKPQMLLLPYGIPITVAAIGYFFYNGMM